MHAVQLKKSQNYHTQFNMIVSYSNPWLIVGRNSAGMNKYVNLAKHNGMGDKTWWIFPLGLNKVEWLKNSVH